MAAIIYDSNRGMVNTNHNQGKVDVMYGGTDVSHKGADIGDPGQLMWSHL